MYNSFLKYWCTANIINAFSVELLASCAFNIVIVYKYYTYWPFRWNKLGKSGMLNFIQSPGPDTALALLGS
jgi:hypothetical protein